ncbi:hypothetical protein [Pseudomonas sp. UV AK001]|uniref:hypothetical protein n=1 Tax=Pseudomonas sp. UV AK001 TaxID=3384791 RepID=UPI0038D3C210
MPVEHEATLTKINWKEITMLPVLEFKEADGNGVIKLSEIVSHANGVIAPLSDPQQGDEADIFANEDLIATVTLSTSGETEFEVSKRRLLDFAGAGPTSFRYVVYIGGGGKDLPSEVKDFVIEH